MPVDIKTGGPFDFVSDAADWVGDRVNDVWDALDDLPGFQQLGEGTKAVFKGPLRDFAKNEWGQMVIRAITTMAMGPIGLVSGPWAMMIAAGMPGIVRGEPFTEAILTENLWRLQETIKILAPKLGDAIGEKLSELFGQQLNFAAGKLKELAESMPGANETEKLYALAQAHGMSPEAYARKFAQDNGLREDIAVEALELLSGQKLLSHESYDLETGAYIRKVPIPTQVVQTKMATLQPRNALAAYLAKTATAPISVLRPTVSVQSPLMKAIRPDVDIVSAFRSSSVEASPPPPPPPPPAPPMMLDRMASNAPPAPEQGKGNTLLYIGAAGMLGLAVWYGMRHRR